LPGTRIEDGGVISRPVVLHSDCKATGGIFGAVAETSGGRRPALQATGSAQV